MTLAGRGIFDAVLRKFPWFPVVFEIVFSFGMPRGSAIEEGQIPHLAKATTLSNLGAHGVGHLSRPTSSTLLTQNQRQS